MAPTPSNVICRPCFVRYFCIKSNGFYISSQACLIRHQHFHLTTVMDSSLHLSTKVVHYTRIPENGLTSNFGIFTWLISFSFSSTPELCSMICLTNLFLTKPFQSFLQNQSHKLWDNFIGHNLSGLSLKKSKDSFIKTPFLLPYINVAGQ